MRGSILTGPLFAMCPLYNQRANNVITESRVNEWLNTALCCIALFHQHRISKRIICDECFSDENPIFRGLYEDVSRHYLHIGHGKLFEVCQECDVGIPRNRASNECLVCRIALNDFEEYYVIHVIGLSTMTNQQ